MLRQLAGNQDSVNAFNAALNKQIAAVEMRTGDPDALRFTFTDETAIEFRDEGQSCCEDRFMTTDDDLPSFVGSTILDAEIADGPTTEGEYEERETQFLNVKTSVGVLTVVTHNRHNGYYGGFSVEVRTVTDEEDEK